RVTRVRLPSCSLHHARLFLSCPTRRSSDLVEHPGAAFGRLIEQQGLAVALIGKRLGCQLVVFELVNHLDRVLEGRLQRRHLDGRDRKSTRLNSSHVKISYAVFCLKKKRVTQ